MMEGRRLLAPLALVASAGALVLVTFLITAPAGPTELDFKPPWEQTPPHYNRYRFVHTNDKSAGIQQQLVQTDLHYTPPWEQTPPHFNRYRFDRSPESGRQQQLLMKKVAAPVAAHANTHHARVHKVLNKVHHKRTGKMIWARMLGAMAKSTAHAKKNAAKMAPPVPKGAPGSGEMKAFQQGLAAADAELLEDPNAVDVNDDAPAETIYIYRGRETKPKVDEMVTFILAGGFGIPDIKYIEDSSDAEMRKALWDKECRAVIFPPLHDIPDFGPNAVKDLQHYVSAGMKNHGTVLFMGSSVEIHVINKIFGFEMQQDFKPGPYYKSERHTHGTALELLPDRVNELGQTESLGILKASLPPEGRSFYDSFGDSVAACVRYDLGRVCYLAQDFKPLEEMPHLQVELESEDEEVAEEAERRLEALGRRTDTWLAIFQGMLDTPAMEDDNEGNWDGW